MAARDLGQTIDTRRQRIGPNQYRFVKKRSNFIPSKYLNLRHCPKISSPDTHVVLHFSICVSSPNRIHNLHKQSISIILICFRIYHSLLSISSLTFSKSSQGIFSRFFFFFFILCLVAEKIKVNDISKIRGKLN